jgi:AraC-like DNA-binding protein
MCPFDRLKPGMVVSQNQEVGMHTMLAQNIERWIKKREGCETAIPELTFFRRDTPTHPDICLVEPSVVIVAQGAKQMFVGGEPYRYDPASVLITSLDLPAHSQVVEATALQPCLGLTLKLDLGIMADLVTQHGLVPPPEQSRSTSMAVSTLTPALLNPVERLVDLLDEPSAVPVLAPLIQREIHYRLLMGDQAARLWQIIAVGTQSHQIARLINWLKVNYASPLRVEELAASAQMSPSTFHQYFRELTTMSPLQYQKWLRLNEARKLMLNDHLDAATAGFQVGYDSPSQFSREYSRLFGAPPRRDIENFRRRVDVLALPRAGALNDRIDEA